MPKLDDADEIVSPSVGGTVPLTVPGTVVEKICPVPASAATSGPSPPGAS